MNKATKNCSFIMPAEFEKQKLVWIVWPYNKNDWPGYFTNIPLIIANIISKISNSQKVNLIIQKKENKNKILKLLKERNFKKSNVKFYKINTDRIWIRDSGPIYVKNKLNGKKAILNFKFNGWSKYQNFKKDNKIPSEISRLTKVKSIIPYINNQEKKYYPVLEGGAFDVNGNGSILLTKECLLSKKQERNPGLSKKDYQTFLKKYLGVENFIWLNKGIEGDDTHGHVDDISRFISNNTIMTSMEKNKKEKNFKILNENFKILKNAKDIKGKKFRIIKIPMPKAKYIDKVRVPATYLNFFIGNKIVLLPVFNDINDMKVIKIFKNFFKYKKIVTIDCSELIWGFGAIHCMTQQEPDI
tara:strand:+ start:266 stop:1336 length:1071 start_codon:yes stop_codon:yes gene_type:complete